MIARGRARHPVTGGEGAHRDPHGAEEQPDSQVEQCEEEEGRPQQGPSAAGMSGALASGPGRGAALSGQRRSPAENQARGDGAGQGRVTDRAERGHQDGPEKESGGIGQRLQREGGGQLTGPLAAQQVRPAGPGQGAELGNNRTGAGRGGDLRCRSGGRKDNGDSGAVGQEAERQDASLAEPVDQAGQLRADQSLGEGESGGGQAGGAVGAGAGMQQPDQAETGHGDTDAASTSGEEEGGGTGGAQQGTVAGSGAGHESVLHRRPAG